MMPTLEAIIAAAYGVDEAVVRAWVEQRKRAHERRVARKNARYEEAWLHCTPAQAAHIDTLRRQGARVHNRIRQHRVSHNIVVFLSKPTWDSTKGRIGSKLYAVYPDGTHHETFERTISVRKEF